MLNQFSDKFGFTESEIIQILDKFNIQEHKEIIREWYDGYSFGGQIIYNPWSVISYIQAIPNPPGPKWLNTASNHLIYEELMSGGIAIKRDLERLLSGEVLRYPLLETITFRDIGKNPVNIWSFLFFSGYLKADLPETDIRGRITYNLTIPNKEVSFAYDSFIELLYPETDGGLDALMDCFIGKRTLNDLNLILNDLTISLVSMYDLARLPEAVFHAFVLGLLANLRYIYEIRSNVETGCGRADILMLPKTKKYNYGYVIEFKSISERSDVEKSVQKSFTQINEKNYASLLLNAGVSPEMVIYLVIILQGKKVTVKSHQ